MKKRFIDYYMDIAQRTAMLSRAKRLQVGAIIVKDDKIISYGYNGTPKNWNNNCEMKIYPSDDEIDYAETTDLVDMYPYKDENNNICDLKTVPEVLHAETNAITKLAKSIESGEGAVMFITHAPCIDCAKMIYQAGISLVFFKEVYRGNSGLEFLKKVKINVSHHPQNG